MPIVGVVLAGCGVYDGAEIHETVLTMLALDRAGAEMVLMAPDIDQLHVVNHLTGEEMSLERRNVLVESARIARGKISDIATVDHNDLDALVFPGGFGVAKNLCDYAMVGATCVVNPAVSDLTHKILDARKPVGVMCIAPVLLAKLVGGREAKVNLTIGKDPATAADINKMGVHHVNCAVNDVVVDTSHKIVSTPAYMLAGSIREAAEGIEKLVRELLALID